MTCAACGATIAKRRSHCQICGRSRKPQDDPLWDRTVEAATYEVLSQVLEGDETLLGFTRGRLTARWTPRSGINPRLLLSQYANFGLTSDRIILMPVQSGSGSSPANSATSFPVRDVCALNITDIDPLEPGRTVRLTALLTGGESLRLKAAGRLAATAQDIVTVWRSLYAPSASDVNIPDRCEHCGRELDRPYRFCPFCGSAQQSTE